MRIFEPRASHLAPRLGTALAILALCASCGKKGPPLAPLIMAPEAPQAVVARRLGDTVYLEMKVPAKSASGRGPFSVDHIDVYAVTIAPDTVYPPNRDLLKPEHIVGKIPIQPPPDPDAPEPDTPDARAKPGETVTFVEKLTDAQLVPQVITKPAPMPKLKGSKTPVTPPPAPVLAPGAPPPPPLGPLVLSRLYVLQGVPKGGRGTAPAPRIEVPLLQAPGPPRAGTATSDETSVILTWEPPASTTDEAPGVTYNVYPVLPDGSTPAPAGRGVRPPAPSTPLMPVPFNDKPITEQRFAHDGAEPEKEQCFAVRSVATIGTVKEATIESDPTAPICITPKDTYPPAAPKGLAVVASAGVVNLIWDANTDKDLAGYIVLRGTVPGDTLQQITREPIRETRYGDRTATPGTRYAYQVIAVDKAGNKSAPSNKVEESAREP